VIKNVLAIFSLINSHIERCYAENVTKIELEEVFAMEIYRTLILSNQALTEGIVKAIKMTFWNMFRIRSRELRLESFTAFQGPLFQVKTKPQPCRPETVHEPRTPRWM
jgi:hypothetical protein